MLEWSLQVASLWVICGWAQRQVVFSVRQWYVGSGCYPVSLAYICVYTSLGTSCLNAYMTTFCCPPMHFDEQIKEFEWRLPVWLYAFLVCKPVNVIVNIVLSVGNYWESLARWQWLALYYEALHNISAVNMAWTTPSFLARWQSPALLHIILQESCEGYPWQGKKKCYIDCLCFKGALFKNIPIFNLFWTLISINHKSGR